MGQETKFQKHNISENELHEIELTQQYLDNIKLKRMKDRAGKESNIDEDKHEVILYDHNGRPANSKEAVNNQLLFTPRFSFIDKKYSKYHRILMAILCSCTSFL